MPKFIRQIFDDLADIQHSQKVINDTIRYRKTFEEAEVVDVVIVAGYIRDTQEVRRVFGLFLNSNVRIVNKPEDVMGMEIKHFIVMKGAEEMRGFPVLMDTIRQRIR